MGFQTQITVECEHGLKIQVDALAESTGSKMIDFGIISVDDPLDIVCMSRFTKRCEPVLKRDKLMSDIRAECNNKNHCHLNQLK